MFHKEGSFNTSGQGKKAKDTPLKKSDRRRLRDRFTNEILGSSITNIEVKEINSNDANDTNTSDQILVVSTSSQRVKAIEDLVQDIFMNSKCEIMVRTIKQKSAKSNAGATKVYIRSPSTTTALYTSNDDMDDDKEVQDNITLDPILKSWPYTIHQQPILIEIPNPHTNQLTLIPTMALLSILPSDILYKLPTIIIPQMVSKYICRGADLMRSGIFNLPTNHSGWVCIQVERNIQPMAVGFISKGTSLETVGAGTKGVGVHVVTSYGDDIWKSQCRSSSNSEIGKGVTDGNNVQSMIGGGLFNNGDYGNNGFIDGSLVHSLQYGDENEESGHDEDETSEEMESSNKNEKEDVSNTSPSCTESELSSVVNQLNDTVLSTTKESKKSSSTINQQKKTSKAQEVKKMAVVNLYIIPQHIVSALHLDKDAVKASQAKSEERKGTGYLTTPECRQILDVYCRGNDLLDEFDPEFVTLDASLYDVLYRRNRKDVVNASDVPDEITRKELNSKWMKVMDNAYAIVSMPGNNILTMKRGKPPVVQIEVKTRENRKKFVTYVRGMEEYGVDASEFANDVAKRFACSSSISDNPVDQMRAALKKGRVEVMFQGNLARELEALLTGNEKLTGHGGAKGGSYRVPKGVIQIEYGKGMKKTGRK